MFSEVPKANRDTVLHRLQTVLPENNLFELAQIHQIPTSFKGKKNKGWVGQTIERVAGFPVSNVAEPDGEDFELKTTRVKVIQEKLIPQETLKITQLNPQKILEEDFEKSLFWKKLERLILVAYETADNDQATVKSVLSIDIKNQATVSEIKEFWEDVRHVVCSGEIRDFINMGSSQSLIQLRPLGDGKQKSRCPVSGDLFPARAFYATKRLLNHLLNVATL